MTIVMDRRQVLAGLAAGSVVALSGCAQNPHLGRSQLILVSEDELAAMSLTAWTEIKKTERLSRDRGANRKVERIGARIVDAANAGDRNWEFHVIDSDIVNAFVMPGGQVAFYQGILDLMENDDQIACVMGHECGHVMGRHAAERASQQMAAGLGLTLVNLAIAQTDIGFRNELCGILGAGVTFGVILPYSRQHEFEADRLGCNYMSAANYRPREALAFWETMAARGGNTVDFMSTHPSDAKRIAALQRHIATLPA